VSDRSWSGGGRKEQPPLKRGAERGSEVMIRLRNHVWLAVGREQGLELGYVPCEAGDKCYLCGRGGDVYARR
jgi:hypothetical protein